MSTAGRRAGGIDFRGQSWWATPHNTWRDRARSDDFPMWLRIHYAAMGWVNRIGHAEFGPGQLASILDIPDDRAGRVQISRAIRAAKDKGLILSESSVRCLSLPADDHQQNGRGTARCYTCGVNLSY